MTIIKIIQNIDWSILFFIQNHMVNPINNKIMIFITSLGNIGLIWIVLSIIFILSKKHRNLGIMIIIGLILELIIGNGILKNIFQRPRPCWIDHSVHLLIPVPKDYSFPSAHAFSCFISGTIIAKYNKRWGIFALVLAALISFSRLYLFVHFPSDVLVGAILGVIFGNVIYNIFNRLIQNKKRKLQ